ncbi:PAS domain-containing protein [Gloeothece verrucosa]|nr:PAS domain S-box protein [Gloeothece verrucosa]
MTGLASEHQKQPQQNYQEDLLLLQAEIAKLKQENQEYLQKIKTLEEKERLLQLVLDNIPQLIFWKDKTSVFKGCNRLWAKAAGFSDPNQVMGKTDYDLYPNATNIEQYIEKDRQVITSGKSTETLEYKPNKDVWYNTKKIPIEDTQGNIVGILATIEDITGRKKAEEKLRLAEEKYRGIFENALEGIFQTTAAGVYMDINPAMARIYGYESPEEMKANVRDISTQIYANPQQREEFQRWIEETGQVKGFEYQTYRRDGTKIWVEENTRVVRNEQGQVLYYEGIIQDITQRKQEQEALKRQVQELRIEIDQQKRASQVAEITQTSYFQELQAEVDSLRLDEEEF